MVINEINMDVETILQVLGFLISLWSVNLLIVNAILIFFYLRETRKQANATLKLAEDSKHQTEATLDLVRESKHQTEATLLLSEQAQKQAESALEQAKLTAELVALNRKDFEPSVQIVFTERKGMFNTEARDNGQSRRFDENVILDLRDDILIIEINFINLSKGITDFWIEINNFTTFINTIAGNTRLQLCKAFASGYFPVVLKPKEITEGKLVFDITKGDDHDRIDFTCIDIFRSSELYVSYRVKYKSGIYEEFSEYWVLSIEDVKMLRENVYIFIGRWSDVTRGYFENFPNKQ